MSLENYLNRLSDNQHDIFEWLDSRFLDFPGVSQKIRYKIVFYDYITWVCYLNPIKGDGIELCFIKGKELSAHPMHLHSKDRKMIAGISIFKVNEIDEDLVLSCFAEALMLNEEKRTD